MNRRILLVEDNDMLRMLLSCMLEHTGYRVTTAPDGETAIQLLMQHSFDMVVTDIHIGHVSGIEVLKMANAQPYLPATIAMTGDGSPETIVAVLRAGANDCLLKPFQDTELLERIYIALERRGMHIRVAEPVYAMLQPPKQPVGEAVVRMEVSL